MSWFPVNEYTGNTTRSGCLICANDRPRPGEVILSTGFSINEFDGTPDICSTCIGEAATMLGWHSGPEFEKETKLRKAAEAEAAELHQQLDDRAATVRTLTSELSDALDSKAVKVGASKE